MEEIEFEKNPKCEICKKEINVDREQFIMKRENGKDKYVHAECYNKSLGIEVERIFNLSLFNLSFVDWKSPLDKI